MTAETTTAAARFLADARAMTIELDSFNRYVAPDPVTGEKRHWRRATTHAGRIKDSFGLNRWSLREAAEGFAMRPDLLAVVAEFVSTYGSNNYGPGVDCRPLDEAIAQAQAHAGATVGSTMGTTMHRFTELLDERGEMPEVVPPPLDHDLEVYRETMAASGFEPVAIERLVCLPDLGVAGTLDRVLSRGADAYVGDLKTGKDLGYSWPEIAIQLALYAHAPYMWEGDGWVDKPAVSTERAIVVHLPVGQARCTLHWVDIAAGWEAATEIVPSVEDWRSRKGLATVIDLSSLPAPDAVTTNGSDVGSPSPPAADGPAQGQLGDPAAGPPTAERSEWISNRFLALKDDERARTLIGLRWPDGIEARPPWSDSEVDALAAMLDDIEAEVGQPFGDSDPAVHARLAAEAPRTSPTPREAYPAWDIADDGVEASGEVVAGLRVAVSMLDGDQAAHLHRWANEAIRERRAFTADPMTRRMAACAVAAYSCAAHLPDDLRVRNALARVIGDWHEGWVTGAVIGSLSIDQAEALHALADAYAAGERSGIDPV